MIGFVLDDARRVMAGRQFEALAVTAPRAQLDLERPRHLTADVRNAETSLPVLLDLAADRRDFGIDDRNRRRRRLAGVVVVEARDEQPQPLMDLRRRQAD